MYYHDNSSEKKNTAPFSRRDFLKSLAAGGGAFFLAGNMKLLGFQLSPDGKLKAVVVDYSKCTGCRTCEMVCSAVNHKTMINGKAVWGTGNPALSNIKVQNFNPDVDVPVVCALCPDAPCVEACPVEPDKEGRKALYKHPKTGAVTHNSDRCIACGSCIETCSEQRTACIGTDKNGMPTGICNLCEGDPECVKNCPFDALQYVEVDTGRDWFGWSADKIAEQLTRKWYTLEAKGGAR